ncbi:MAG: PHP domain-containing protein [Elusimicrobiota bacterium]|jgi:predicted metal-dependent phosphoesterase TrpH|nr:PHP domain-containing protein [Elusimicrobiota bacterium]
MPLIDLHAHTKFSDGTTTPSEVVYAYLKAGVQMMSITDHDTLEALPAAAQKAKEHGMLFINGVEISTQENDHLHILGYNIDPQNQALQDFLAQNRQKRNVRIKKIIKQLQDSGVNITEEDVFSLVKTVASRAHVADALKKNGIVPTRQEGFRKYLVKGKAGYTPVMGADVVDVISMIHKAGGLAFIAHPGIIKDAWNFPLWVQAGLDGIEVYYPSHSFELRQDLLGLAKKYNLLISGGSDHHGNKSGRDNKPGMQVPDEVFNTLKKVFFK